MKPSLFVLICLLTSCGWLGDKAKETAKAGGEMAGEVAGEFIEGVHDGVEEVTSPTLELHERLEAAGVEIGESRVEGTENKNTLQVYLITHKAIDQLVRFVARNSEGKEIGRADITLQGVAGSAGYHDIVFDERTHLETSSSVRLVPVN